MARFFVVFGLLMAALGFFPSPARAASREDPRRVVRAAWRQQRVRDRPLVSMIGVVAEVHRTRLGSDHLTQTRRPVITLGSRTPVERMLSSGGARDNRRVPAILSAAGEHWAGTTEAPMSGLVDGAVRRHSGGDEPVDGTFGLLDTDSLLVEDEPDMGLSEAEPPRRLLKNGTGGVQDEQAIAREGDNDPSLDVLHEGLRFAAYGRWAYRSWVKAVDQLEAEALDATRPRDQDRALQTLKQYYGYRKLTPMQRRFLDVVVYTIVDRLVPAAQEIADAEAAAQPRPIVKAQLSELVHISGPPAKKKRGRPRSK